ncbi:chloride channel [Phanerochaete sordida]|uniref:Chloride channel protein n=1 Tax=Phanerochaete sordida TaxID=48140 RepID=A0A9P3LMC3_9APHY|nr:chloride channel [Phanerochaete sordida]
MSVTEGPSLKRSPSTSSLASQHGETPSGPLSGPSSTRWRRQRLLSIGHGRVEDGENTALNGDAPRTDYGSVPVNPRRKQSKARLNLRRGISSLQGLVIPKAISAPGTPAGTSPVSFVEHLSYLRERPISAYDKPNYADNREPGNAEGDVKTNGIRVWYSSFTSIDWLHDAIKDSARQARLRRRKSLRGKTRRAMDRTVGWLVVSIVGFLTAVIAFLITRSEQWLFDFKEGYCRTAWYKSKRFCCPVVDDGTLGFTPAFISFGVEEEACRDWRTWSSVFGPVVDGSPWLLFESEMVEYIAYVVVALTWAIISCLLTIHLTASTSFVTRKDSGVLSPAFASTEEVKAAEPALVDPKRKLLYYAAGSGIPEIKTILSGFVIHGYLGGRTLFTKSVGLALSVASGLSLGKEGPFVHIASCVGNIVSRFFGKYETNEAKRREVLSAACAAGVAVAFGAPIGGVLFSLEEVSYFFPAKVMWRSFFCAMVAAMTLKFLDPFGSGKLVLFQVTYDKDWHAYELIPFLFLGLFGGVWGAWFSKLNIRWAKHIRNGTWLKSHPVVEVVLVTFATSVLCFVNPYTRMSGTELVYNLFAECKTGSANTHQGLCVLNPPEQAWPVVTAIGVAMIVKGALTIVTFGIKLPAGIFIPSLGVGACAGRIVGILVQWAQYNYPHSPMFASCHGDLNCVMPGLYAMVGAAASLSGVTRTTVSLAVIMFELTDTLTYAVPVMLSVLVAKTVADALEPKGIYDLVIDLANLPYLDPKHDYSWVDHQVNDVTDRDVEVIRLDHDNNVKSLRDKLQTLILSGRHDSGLPIVRDDDHGSRLVGYIGANELEHALSIVADHPDRIVMFHATAPYGHAGGMASSFSSAAGDTGSIVGGVDPFDFSYYMDQAPLTVQSNSPLELVQQLFTKLGARYIVVIDTEGYYEGVIDKKSWLAFLGDLDEHK